MPPDGPQTVGPIGGEVISGTSGSDTIRRPLSMEADSSPALMRRRIVRIDTPRRLAASSRVTRLSVLSGGGGTGCSIVAALSHMPVTGGNAPDVDAAGGTQM